MNAGCAGKTVRSLENACHIGLPDRLSSISRRGAIQMHVYLTLPLPVRPRINSLLCDGELLVVWEIRRRVSEKAQQQNIRPSPYVERSNNMWTDFGGDRSVNCQFETVRYLSDSSSAAVVNLSAQEFGDFRSSIRSRSRLREAQGSISSSRCCLPLWNVDRVWCGVCWWWRSSTAVRRHTHATRHVFIRSPTSRRLVYNLLLLLLLMLMVVLAHCRQRTRVDVRTPEAHRRRLPRRPTAAAAVARRIHFWRVVDVVAVLNGAGVQRGRDVGQWRRQRRRCLEEPRTTTASRVNVVVRRTLPRRRSEGDSMSSLRVRPRSN